MLLSPRNGGQIGDGAEEEQLWVTGVILVALQELLNHDIDMLRIKTEERLGSLIAAAGIIWASYAVTKNFTGVLQLPPLPAGPLEISAIGILVWLHAKWRRSLKN